MRRAILALLLCAAACWSATGAPTRPAAAAPSRTPPRYEVLRARGSIAPDGRPDDPGWRGIPALRLAQAATGTAPSQETEVRACWDDARLYLLFTAHDTEPWSEFTKRDSPLWEGEVVEAFLNPGADPTRYYEYEISPKNVLFDARVVNRHYTVNSIQLDIPWRSGGLRTAVRPFRRKEARGWIAEAALPFADLGLSSAPAPGSAWQANFYRIERKPKLELLSWSPTLRDPPDFHVPDRFGELVFTGQR